MCMCMCMCTCIACYTSASLGTQRAQRTHKGHRQRARKGHSAQAKDTTKDTAHVVFTSSLKTGDVAPTTDGAMYRPPLDNTVTSDVHYKTYDVNLQNQMLDDPTLSLEDNLPVLVKVVDARFAPGGKYYHHKHFQVINPSDYTFELTVPVARQCGERHRYQRRSTTKNLRGWRPMAAMLGGGAMSRALLRGCALGPMHERRVFFL